MCKGCSDMGEKDFYVWVEPEKGVYSKPEYHSVTTSGEVEIAEKTDICIFTSDGHTFTFKDIDFICNNETVVSFSYVAMSDGMTKSATFFKNRIVGYSLTDYTT